ncbi:Fur family transcriptional regulator, ferric uptake regulator [Marinitoga hydrogenitolerans DSM 16785]|uniref:Fur family transcriptional regulator, ferric uptake regulator n=1 Tax=Marinitoga hydrogenitolerans (strain DSM 16785 / JCM 12826 / AT1271) TaxID=1122195 RepID=A0A1M4S4I8_MARH1|nr:Fur family transcriptional regulator [Marinitoga hydrogenitolerans]SHE27115.1 Fur family transcriptional regulator, ferric uptake regulator [Marinitoga hydrogenitolerans DSM 16785]
MSQQILKKVLRDKKQRMTAQRELILKVFIESKGQLMSLDDVYMYIRRRKNHKTSKMTVKRSIDLLEEIGIIKKIDFEDGPPRYELVEEFADEAKVLLICENCGKAIKMDLDIEKLKSILPYENMEIKDFDLKIYGLCTECK